MAIKRMEVPDSYRYVLDRGNFEYLRGVQNLVFMLSKHSDDSDDSFLKSELFRELEHEAEEGCITNITLITGVVYNLFGGEDAHVPSKYWTDDNNRFLVYEDYNS